MSKNLSYYILLFSMFILNFSLIPLLFEILEQRLTSNIPYITLISFWLVLVIYLFRAILKEYYIYSLFLMVGIITLSIIIYLKTIYDKNNTFINEVE